jgi:hypothetical protein
MTWLLKAIGNAILAAVLIAWAGHWLLKGAMA